MPIDHSVTGNTGPTYLETVGVRRGRPTNASTGRPTAAGEAGRLALALV